MPMSPQNLEMLDTKLAEVDAAPLSQVDGLLMGVIVCPHPIEPGDWLPLVLLTEDNTPVVFGDPAQQDALVRLLIDYYTSRVEDLDGGRYEALFEVDEDDEVLWGAWAEGFMLSLSLAPPEVWETLLSSPDEDVADAIAMLMTFVAISQGETPPELEGEDELAMEAPSLIPDCIETLHRSRRESKAVGAS
jgi:uncharacterized protein